MRRSRLTAAACCGAAGRPGGPECGARTGRAGNPRSIASDLNTTWVIVAGVLVMFMQAGFLFLETGLLARQERGRGRREGPRRTSRSPRSCGGPAGSRIAFGGAGWLAGDSGFFFQYGSTISARQPRRGHRGRSQRRVLLLPVRLLRGVAGDRLGDDARADQVHRVPDLRGRLLGDHLPADRPLDLRRRLPRVGRQRRAGLRRLDGRPPHPVRPARSPRCCCSAPARASTGRTASRARSRATRCRSSASAS